MSKQNIIFSDDVIAMLDKHKEKVVEVDSKYIYAKELYILSVFEELSTKHLSRIFNVSPRYIQMKMKELGINRSLRKAKDIFLKDNHNEYSLISKKIIKIPLPEIKSDFVIYRFVDKENKNIYIGSCSRSENSYTKNGKKYFKEYFIKERLQHHFSKSQKHLPHFIYNDVYKIQYFTCSNYTEMIDIEGNLILDSKIKGECIWNGCYPLEITLDVSDVKWKDYKILTDIERETHRLHF